MVNFILTSIISWKKKLVDESNHFIKYPLFEIYNLKNYLILIENQNKKMNFGLLKKKNFSNKNIPISKLEK